MIGWERDPGVLWRRSGDRIILVPPGRDDSVLLEGTGAVTWLLLDTPIDHTELVTLLADTFGVDADIVDAEVTAFLRELEDLDAVSAS